MTTEHVTADPPKHPLHAMTTFELWDYRRELERAIPLLDGPDPVPPMRRDLQTRLDDRGFALYHGRESEEEA